MKKVLQWFYDNHVLANLLFGLVLVMGFLSYANMPREQDPSINFNWIQITTIYPGAAAEEVEKLVTDPLEEALAKVTNTRFVSSTSREGVSSILVRFNDMDTETFDKKVKDLRREIQGKEDELPEEAKSPRILEITSANAFPSALLVVVGTANDERLRKQAKNVKEDLERFSGVDRVESFGLHDPELQIIFNPKTLIKHRINAIDIVNSIQSGFRDISGGTIDVGNQQWLVRWLGRDDAPESVSKLPIMAANEELMLGEVAKVQRAREKASRLVNFEGKNAVLLSVMKASNTNTIELVEEVKDYIIKSNITSGVTGIQLVLLDDQTEITRNALNVMQNNAFIGLLLVLFTTWLFLGLRISLLVSIGIPFTLAGTFWLLDGLDNSLNVTVLLGVVITLGMIVDDSVVVVEAIYFRLNQGKEKMRAILDALQEVFAPVSTSVLTTIAAFVPLMLLPGILGKFMMVIPMVVTVALLLSLVEAYWMLPAHINATKLQFSRSDPIHFRRQQVTRWLRVHYIRLLVKVFRRPIMAFAILLVILGSAFVIVAKGYIHFNFFANDPLRIFYVNIEMPAGTSLEGTLKRTRHIEDKVRQYLAEKETRSVTAYAGLMFSETEPFLGDHYGQIAVSLKPQKNGMRPVDQVIEDMRQSIVNTAGPVNISFLRLAGGPPTSKPINIKVRGNNYIEIRKAVGTIIKILNDFDAVYDITNDDSLGRRELLLKPNFSAIHRAGLNPGEVARLVRLLIDGEIITDYQSEGEKVDVRVKARGKNYSGIYDVLQQTIAINGKEIRLSEIVEADAQPSIANIRHYNFRRSITVQAELDKTKSDTVAINQAVLDQWYNNYSKEFPGIDLNFTGELDDIEESLNAIPKLFLFGVGIIYLILGTQFRSYLQPLMILTTVPLAFSGVIFGLLVTQNPLSLYTLYGIIALSGITINASIVLISAANQRLKAGMTLEHATLYSARRRLIPILITSLTTIAGLFSLATGLGGKSLLWGPVATSIVWGLMFSTTLTLFFIPLLYRIAMSKKTQVSSSIT